MSLGEARSEEREAISVAKLARGDSLLVEFRSWGCDAFPERAELTLSGPTPKSALVRRLFIVGDRMPEIQAGAIALADSDLVGLDR
ncbi:MAG: hypothetical protein ABIO78_02430, partial [Thermoanaerobaculia bacterium]